MPLRPPCTRGAGSLDLLSIPARGKDVSAQSINLERREDPPSVPIGSRLLLFIDGLLSRHVAHRTKYDGLQELASRLIGIFAVSGVSAGSELGGHNKGSQ